MGAQLLILVRWLISVVLAALALVTFSLSARHGYHIFNLNPQTEYRRGQIKIAEDMYQAIQTENQGPIPQQTIPLDEPIERLLKALTQKPISIQVYIERLSDKTEQGTLARARLHLIGNPTRVARFIQDLEQKGAGLLVTGITVEPGSSSDSPTRWHIDGVLP